MFAKRNNGELLQYDPEKHSSSFPTLWQGVTCNFLQIVGDLKDKTKSLKQLTTERFEDILRIQIQKTIFYGLFIHSYNSIPPKLAEL